MLIVGVGAGVVRKVAVYLESGYPAGTVGLLSVQPCPVLGVGVPGLLRTLRGEVF